MAMYPSYKIGGGGTLVASVGYSDTTHTRSAGLDLLYPYLSQFTFEQLYNSVIISDDWVVYHPMFFFEGNYGYCCTRGTNTYCDHELIRVQSSGSAFDRYEINSSLDISRTDLGVTTGKTNFKLYIF